MDAPKFLIVNYVLNLYPILNKYTVAPKKVRAMAKAIAAQVIMEASAMPLMEKRMPLTK